MSALDMSNDTAIGRTEGGSVIGKIKSSVQEGNSALDRDREKDWMWIIWSNISTLVSNTVWLINCVALFENLDYAR